MQTYKISYTIDEDGTSKEGVLFSQFPEETENYDGSCFYDDIGDLIYEKTGFPATYFEFVYVPTPEEMAERLNNYNNQNQ